MKSPTQKKSRYYKSIILAILVMFAITIIGGILKSNRQNSNNDINGGELFIQDDETETVWWLHPKSKRFVATRPISHVAIYEQLKFKSIPMRQAKSLRGKLILDENGNLFHYTTENERHYIPESNEETRNFIREIATRISKEKLNELIEQYIKEKPEMGAFFKINNDSAVWYLNPENANFYLITPDEQGFFTLQYLAHSVENRELKNMRARDTATINAHLGFFVIDEESNEIYYLNPETKTLEPIKNSKELKKFIEKAQKEKITKKLLKTYKTAPAWIWEKRKETKDKVILYVNGEEVKNKEFRLGPTDTIEITNGLIKAIYPFPNTGPSHQAAWNHYLKTDETWLLTNAKLYGDYNYFVDNFRNFPYEVKIETLSDEEVTISTSFHQKNWREEDALAYFHKGEILVKKTVKVKKDISGVFVKFESEPKNPFGERELGFGKGFELIYGKAPKGTTFIAAGERPLFEKGTQHTLLIDETRPKNPYEPFITGFPLHANYYALMKLPYGMMSYHYHFALQRLGQIAINEYLEKNDRDGYVFLGYYPFPSPQLTQKITPQIEKNTTTIDFAVPETGTYFLAGKIKSHEKTKALFKIENEKKEIEIPNTENKYQELPLFEELSLEKGTHKLEIETSNSEKINLEKIFLIPLSCQTLTCPLDAIKTIL